MSWWPCSLSLSSHPNGDFVFKICKDLWHSGQDLSNNVQQSHSVWCKATLKNGRFSWLWAFLFPLSQYVLYEIRHCIGFFFSFFLFIILLMWGSTDEMWNAWLLSKWIVTFSSLLLSPPLNSRPKIICRCEYGGKILMLAWNINTPNALVKFLEIKWLLL